jgi:hypothetical protein
MDIEAIPSDGWNLGFSGVIAEDESDDDDDSVTSDGSCITLESHSSTIVILNSMARNPATTTTL